MYIKYMDFECTAMGSKSAESVNKLFEFVESLSHVWGVSTVFNHINKRSLVPKSSETCSK